MSDDELSEDLERPIMAKIRKVGSKKAIEECEGGAEEPAKKKIATNLLTPWSEGEVILLTDRYIEERDDYEAAFTSASKCGKSVKERLCCKWANDLSSLGSSLRTPAQVMAKIREMKKTAAKAAAREKESVMRTGGGAPIKPPAPHIGKLAEVLKKGTAQTGISGASESFSLGGSIVSVFVNKDVMKSEFTDGERLAFEDRIVDDPLERPDRPKTAPAILEATPKAVRIKDTSISSRRSRVREQNVEEMRTELLRNELEVSRKRLHFEDERLRMARELHQAQLDKLGYKLIDERDIILGVDVGTNGDVEAAMFMNILDRERRDRALSRPRLYRLRTCPFDTLDDSQFKSRFRFTRVGFFNLVDMLDADMSRTTQRACPLTSAQRLAVTLQILASNSFQVYGGDFAGVSQSTTSRVVTEVTDWFVDNQAKFIVWPSKRETLETQRRIFDKSSIPSVVGLIDGSHVRIIAPSEDEPAYVNRKFYHSLNVSAVVNDKYKFLWLTTRYPGSCHDSRVFRESQLHRAFANGEVAGRLVGDSAYRAEAWMIKIHAGNNLTPAQEAYNRAICNIRVAIEQSFGQLKRQFHCLHGELRYRPTRAAAIVTTCVCLRNASLSFGETVDDLEDVPDQYDQPQDPPGEDTVDTTNGRTTIDSITNNYFS